MSLFRFLNEDAIAFADIRTAPAGFRYGFISDVIQESMYEQLRHSFPDVGAFKLVDKMSGGGHKRFYLGPAYTAGKDWGCFCAFSRLSIWREFIREAASPQATALLSKTTGFSFNSLSNFGLTFGNELCVQEPHIDGAAREYDPSPVQTTFASIVYFNEHPQGVGGTCIYAPDRSTILFQAPSMRNGLFFFEQHPQAWHGFPVMPAGAERRILSLAYSQESRPIDLKEGIFHKMACKQFWKSVIKK